MGPLVAILAVLALAAPASAAVPFGFHGVDYDREAAWAPAPIQAEMWAEMRRSGVQSARVIFDWSEAQKTPGAPPSWHETDPLMVNAATQGIEPLPVVLYAPRWARAVPGEKQSAPADPKDYTAYLAQLVARYGPGGTFWAEHPELPARPIGAWQIWNEPDMEYQWVPRKNWQAGYGRLVREARTALTAADPGAKLVLAGVTNFSWRSLRTMYELGRIEGAFDVAALNAYTREPANLVEIVRRARKVMSARGDGKVPIYVTEFGASASQGRITVGRDRDHLQTTDRKLAKLVVRAYDALAANRKRLRVGRAYWYTWASSYDRRGDIFDFSGLVRFGEGDATFSERQALGAYRKSARKLQAVSRR
ncbi:MAG: hypothetical protein M3340_18135 [Actinomycetota bacterium]|nr:hypothetical protein [Actinomycetota bacterium]